MCLGQTYHGNFVSDNVLFVHLDFDLKDLAIAFSVELGLSTSFRERRSTRKKEQQARLECVTSYNGAFQDEADQHFYSVKLIEGLGMKRSLIFGSKINAQNKIMLLVVTLTCLDLIKEKFRFNRTLKA